MHSPEHPSRTQPIRVALVEDDPRFCERIRKICTANPSQVLLAGVYSTAEAAQRSLPVLQPEVVLVDIRLPGASGIELVQQLTPSMPTVRFSMLTVIPDWDCIHQAILAGALGYMIKREAEDSLVESIIDLMNDGSPMTNAIARRVLVALRQNLDVKHPCPLTPREEEVVVAFARGATNKEIAESLGISDATVRTIAQKVFKKLHVKSRAEAAKEFERLRGRKLG